MTNPSCPRPQLPEGLCSALAHSVGLILDLEPGQLWRALDWSGNRAMLVWVRKVFTGICAVMPVIIEVDMADEDSLVIDAQDSPLGMSLAVLVSVYTEVDRDRLLHPMGILNIADDVKLIEIFDRDIRPAHLRTGAPIEHLDDPRIEFRSKIGMRLG